ncbi:MAG: SAVED domain-containing protein [Candidatus Hodarchaeales archaeon]
MLWAGSAGRCQFDGCNKLVSREWVTKKRGAFAEVAHIIGNRLEVPGRERIKLAPDYCNNIENLMLLCPEHHKLIDYEHPESYSDKVLRNMKETHEERIEALTSITKDRTSNVIKFGANIESHNAVINAQDAYHAMSLSGWYPANPRPIRLGIGNTTIQDNKPAYWAFQKSELEKQFRREVGPYIEDGSRNHFSVFALAPIPLLIKLGVLLSDVHPAEVYQLHREPSTWEWQEGPDVFEFIVEKSETSYPIVALVIALSDYVIDERVYRVLGNEKVSIWRLTIASPDKDFLKSHKQLQLFREDIRRLFGEIKLHHGEKATIHIFPAIGVAPAVELGRVWQPKADLPMVIYDENKSLGGFVKAITIDS